MQILFFLALGLSFALANLTAAEPQLGLTLGPGGMVLKDGKPYRGLGINYFDCFYRTLKNNDDTSYEEGFRVLAEHHIPFVRFCATGFWPNNLKLYQENREKYFRLMDGVVHTAEKYHIGLIPSLFWFYPCVPDLMREPCDQWGNPDSKTHAFMRQYTHDVVSRYRNSPAIWAWEFGNEYDTYADLPNADTFLPTKNAPKVDPKQGTPSKRTPRDYPKMANNIVAFREFAKAVRRDDPCRLIENGCSIIRKNSWHFYNEKSWEIDTPDQAQAILAAISPDPMNLISVHCYQDLPKAKGFWRDEQDRLDGVVAAAKKIGKPVFVGEFQYVNDYAPDSSEARKSFLDFLTKLDRLQVPLAAVWVFDLPAQDSTHNISATNPRAWELKLIQEYNERIARSSN